MNLPATRPSLGSPGMRPGAHLRDPLTKARGIGVVEVEDDGGTELVGGEGLFEFGVFLSGSFSHCFFPLLRRAHFKPAFVDKIRGVLPRSQRSIRRSLRRRGMRRLWVTGSRFQKRMGLSERNFLLGFGGEFGMVEDALDGEGGEAVEVGVVGADHDAVGADFLLQEGEVVGFLGFEADEELVAEVAAGVFVAGRGDGAGHDFVVLFEAVHVVGEPAAALLDPGDFEFGEAV